MKRVLTCALTLVMLLTLSVPAFADIVWEPDNSFYEKHRGECTYIGRGYYANGPDGFVTLYDAPNGSIVEGQYQNGNTLWVYYQYWNWGCITVFGDEGQVNGWVPMSDLYLVYDHISFEEAYGDQFRGYNGEFADYVCQQDEETFWLWEYPHAGEPKETLPMRQEFLDALRGTENTPSYISKVYTDENGLNWGYVGYMYGIRNFWILLDNPTGDGIMTSCIDKADDLIYNGVLTAPQEPVLPTQSYIPYILVAVVVGATGGILVYFYGKKRKSTD